MTVETLEARIAKAEAILRQGVESGQWSEDVLVDFLKVRFGQLTYPIVPDRDIVDAVIRGRREEAEFLLEERVGDRGEERIIRGQRRGGLQRPAR